MFWSLAIGMVENGTNNHNVLKADLTCNVNKQKILTSVVCCWGTVVCYGGRCGQQVQPRTIYSHMQNDYSGFIKLASGRFT